MMTFWLLTLPVALFVAALHMPTDGLRYFVWPSPASCAYVFLAGVMFAWGMGAVI